MALLHTFNEVIKIDHRISQSTLESETIDLGMKGKHNSTSVRMLHFNMIALATYFLESHLLKSG